MEDLEGLVHHELYFLYEFSFFAWSERYHEGGVVVGSDVESLRVGIYPTPKLQFFVYYGDGPRNVTLNFFFVKQDSPKDLDLPVLATMIS